MHLNLFHNSGSLKLKRTSHLALRLLQKRALIALVMLWPMFHLPETRAALPDKNAITQWGFANKATTVDEPMRLVLTEKDPANPNKLIERDVAVTDIPQYVRPTPNMGETPRNYALRVIAAQEAHSKLKAEKIAQAINTVLGTDKRTAVVQSTVLSGVGTAIRNPAWNVLVPGDAQLTPIKNGQVTVTGAHNLTYGPSAALQKARADDIKAAKAHNAKPENRNNKVPVPKPLTNNHTGEIGDGVRVVPGQGGGGGDTPSPGARGSLGTMGFDLATEFPGEFPGLPMIATGMDANGSSSVFEFGILGTYVASLHPFAGQTDEEVYLALESLLDAHGLPSTYDPMTRSLFLDGSFGAMDTLYWAATDTGFSDYLTVSYGASEVPEPGTAFLLAAGLAALGVLSARRRRH